MYQAFFFYLFYCFPTHFPKKKPVPIAGYLAMLTRNFQQRDFEYANYVNLQVVLMADYSTLNWASKRFCRKGILGGKPGDIYIALWLKAITLGGHRTGTWHYKHTYILLDVLLLYIFTSQNTNDELLSNVFVSPKFWLAKVFYLSRTHFSCSETQGLLVWTMRYFRASDAFRR